MDKKSGSVLTTLRDIESIFEFGGEIAPFLEELFKFLTDLMPILARANRTMASSTASMPTASDNIASAEMMAQDATNTIMDNADAIATTIDKMLETTEGENREHLEELAQKVNEINVALQFQDITSQHLQQATQIVEAIQTRMQRLFQALQTVGEKNEAIKRIIETYANDLDDVGEIISEDSIHSENAISQDEIDALFGN